MPSSKSRRASKTIFGRVSNFITSNFTRKNKSKSKPKSPLANILSIGQYSPRPKGGSRKNRTRRHSRKH